MIGVTSTARNVRYQRIGKPDAEPLNVTRIAGKVDSIMLPGNDAIVRSKPKK